MNRHAKEMGAVQLRFDDGEQRAKGDFEAQVRLTIPLPRVMTRPDHQLTELKGTHQRKTSETSVEQQRAISELKEELDQ